MRLIDADKLRKQINCEYSDDLGILEKIDEQPTAYDTDEVIGGLYGLKRYENEYDNYYENAMYKMTEYENDTINSTIDEVIKIVKAGGIS